MKSLARVAFLSAVFVSGISFAEGGWFNRPNVIRAAQILAQEVEHLDEELHFISAPDHVIKLIHHFEETVTEFEAEVKFCTYGQAQAEMNHIRQDMAMIRNELNAHPHLLQHPKVYNEWRAMRTAYRNLDHEMFHWNAKRWSQDQVDELKKEMEELEKHR